MEATSRRSGSNTVWFDNPSLTVAPHAYDEDWTQVTFTTAIKTSQKQPDGLTLIRAIRAWADSQINDIVARYPAAASEQS